MEFGIHAEQPESQAPEAQYVWQYFKVTRCLLGTMKMFKHVTESDCRTLKPALQERVLQRAIMLRATAGPAGHPAAACSDA
jgi:hypothetical protein